MSEQHTLYHKDGSVAAIGQISNGELSGDWEWFRKDGTIKRSGYFERGLPAGEWTTYDADGLVYKRSRKKSPAPR